LEPETIQLKLQTQNPMPFDPNLPQENTPLDAAQVRAQFNALKALIDALAPQLARDSGGNWTLVANGMAVTTWQVWSRNDANPNWDLLTHVDPTSFPQTDALMSPGGAWWQVMVVGENVPGVRITAFSNIISFGNVPV
jgi:hypothetical protein